MTITAQTRVGDIATKHPLATRVFAGLGIDFCCGGGATLQAACKACGTDVEQVIGELEQVVERAEGGDAHNVRWDSEPLQSLVDHILAAHHEPERKELARILEMAIKVHRVHGSKDPQRFQGILTTVEAMKTELDNHFLKEEEILFPMILAGNGAMAAQGPIPVMEAEHEAVGGMLRRLRELTDDYRVPDEACNTWRALWHALADIERSLHEHIHLENNILHVRARTG